MERLLDVGMDMLIPQFTTQILKALEDVQSSQKPPFSDGVYWLDIRREWRKGDNGLLLTILPIVFDPLFCRLMRLDGIYMSLDGAKFSMKKIRTIEKDGSVDEYFTYSKGIEHKFPGYALDSENIVCNQADKTIDLREHIDYLASRDPVLLGNYKNDKKNVFGSQARFLSGKP